MGALCKAVRRAEVQVVDTADVAKLSEVAGACSDREVIPLIGALNPTRGHNHGKHPIEGSGSHCERNVYANKVTGVSNSTQASTQTTPLPSHPRNLALAH